MSSTMVLVLGLALAAHAEVRPASATRHSLFGQPLTAHRCARGAGACNGPHDEQRPAAHHRRFLVRHPREVPGALQAVPAEKALEQREKAVAETPKPAFTVLDAVSKFAAELANIAPLFPPDDLAQVKQPIYANGNATNATDTDAIDRAIWGRLDRQVGRHAGVLFSFWALWFVLLLVIYFAIYPKATPEEDPDLQASPEDTLSNGHFICLSDPETCLWACCCPALRWADTEHKLGLLSQPAAFAVVGFVTLLPLLNVAAAAEGYYGASGWMLEAPGFLILAVALFVFRQMLRCKFRVGVTFGTLICDCLFACCCGCCLVAQEARVVKQAYQVGHKAVKHDGLGKSTEQPGEKKA